MQIAFLVAALAVPTALGLHVFLALLAGNPDLDGRPLLATIGTTAFLCIPLFIYEYEGALPAAAVLVLAAVLVVVLRTAVGGARLRVSEWYGRRA